MEGVVSGRYRGKENAREAIEHMYDLRGFRFDMLSIQVNLESRGDVLQLIELLTQSSCLLPDDPKSGCCKTQKQDITESIREDPELYQAYKSNIAMAFVDEFIQRPEGESLHETADKAAERFLESWLPPVKIDLPEPDEVMLESKDFQAVWQAIKSWDIAVPGYLNGNHTGAMGNHAAHIVRILNKVLGESGYAIYSLDPSRIKGTNEQAINTLIKLYNTRSELDTNHISDGYHTFGELYEHRIVIYIALCRILANSDYSGNHHFETNPVWRSRLHSDGSSFDGWFVLGIGYEKGYQITYHLPESKWEACGFAETLNHAPEWDEHTSNDVLTRLSGL